MPRVRKAELEAVVELLDQPADSVEDLARSVVEAIDRVRSSNPCWMVAVKEPTGYIFWGPYWSLHEAEREIGKKVFRLDGKAGEAIIFRVFRPKDPSSVDSMLSGRSRKQKA